MTMRPEGKTLREIRDYVDATWGDVGPAGDARDGRPAPAHDDRRRAATAATGASP